MRAVDTNVLIRLLARDDERQLGAAERFVAQGAWVPHLVLVEATCVLSTVYERSPEAIASAIEQLLDHEHLSLQEPEVVRAAVDRFRGRPKLGFSDCLILEVARKAGHLPLGIFDRRLGRLDGVERLAISSTSR